jgi:hypothetical protein
MQQWLSENGGAVSSGISGFASGIDSMEYSDAANNGFSTVDSLITGGTKTKLGMGAVNAGAGLMNAGLSTGNVGLILAGGIAGTAGTLVNATFGTKTDEEALKSVNNTISANKFFSSNAKSFDDIRSPQYAVNADVYTGGWFSKGKARKKNEELQKKADEANAFTNRAVENNVNNIINTQMSDALANYAAFGGPLDFGWMPISGAIDYELAQRRLAQKDLESKKAFGGPLHTHGADWTNGITIIDNGGSHESNPFEGVPMGIAPDGRPNLVEEGEVIFNDYVFSNRLRVPKAVREKYKLRGQKKMTFADAAKKAQKESEERPNDPISRRGLEDIMYRLMTEQEAVRESRQQRKYSKGGRIHIAPSKKGTFTAAASKHGMGVQEFASKVLANPEDYSPVMRKKANFAKNASKWKHAYGGHLFWDGGSYLRFAPALGAGIGTLTDAFGITNRPDYTNADSITEAARQGIGSIRDVSFTPVGNYLTYRPFDTLFYANQLGAQAGATRRNIMNTSGGNRGAAMAGLLAADYKAQQQLGNLYREAEEYNLAQRERVENFNRTTNEFNSEGFLKAAMANAENSQKKATIRLSAAEKAAAIRDAVDDRVGKARSANLTNLFDSLGNIGIDAYNRQDRDMLIRAGVFGTLSQKPQDWSQERWEDYQKAVSGEGYRNGGVLKKRKGITI